MEKEQKKVTVFGTLTCHWCTMVKSYLKEKNIDFEFKDVTFDYKAGQEMMAKSGQTGVPQIWIDDEVIVGFDKNQIDKSLGL